MLDIEESVSRESTKKSVNRFALAIWNVEKGISMNRGMCQSRFVLLLLAKLEVENGVSMNRGKCQQVCTPTPR